MDVVDAVLRRHLIAKAQHLPLIGHVGDMGGEAKALRQAGCVAEGDGLGHGAGGDIAERDVAALGDQLAHQFAPHAGAAAGDDGRFAREILHCASLLVLREAIARPAALATDMVRGARIAGGARGL